MATGAFILERDDWAAAIGRARGEGWRSIELTAIRGRLDPLLHFLRRAPGALDGFDRVSVHAPAKMDEAPEDVIAALEPLPFEVVLHPDVYGLEPTCARLGARAMFENMDVAKRSGRDLDDLRDVFGRFPDAGLCLDVAHVWTNDRTLRLGHDLLDELGSR